jgi:hypothetical protein
MSIPSLQQATHRTSHNNVNAIFREVIAKKLIRKQQIVAAQSKMREAADEDKQIIHIDPNDDSLNSTYVD